MTRGSNLSFVLVLALSGCATTPAERLTTSPRTLPTLQGSYHRVRTGETLWRIAQSYGLETDTLASANRLSNASQLKAGQRLFIPLPAESDRFLWPVRGSVRNPGTSKGLEIAAAPGSLVRASRSGRVAIAMLIRQSVPESRISDANAAAHVISVAAQDVALVTVGLRGPPPSPREAKAIRAALTDMLYRYAFGED